MKSLKIILITLLLITSANTYAEYVFNFYLHEIDMSDYPVVKLKGSVYIEIEEIVDAAFTSENMELYENGRAITQFSITNQVRNGHYIFFEIVYNSLDEQETDRLLKIKYNIGGFHNLDGDEYLFINNETKNDNDFLDSKEYSADYIKKSYLKLIAVTIDYYDKNKTANNFLDNGFINLYKEKEPINPLLFENKGVAKPISIIPWKQKVARVIADEQLLKVFAYEVEGKIYYSYFTFAKTNNQAVISIYEVNDKGEVYTVFSEATTEYEDADDWHFFNRSTIYIINNYLYFELSSEDDEDYTHYFKYRYELGTKNKIEIGLFLEDFQETILEMYNHRHTAYAQAMNGELTINYVGNKKNNLEFVTKDFEDGFMIGNLSWSIDDRILYFDNHSTGIACIWRYDTKTKELSKIIPEHEAEQGFGFSHNNREYIIYIRENKIMFATP